MTLQVSGDHRGVSGGDGGGGGRPGAGVRARGRGLEHVRVEPGRQFVSSVQKIDALVKITERQWRRHSQRILTELYWTSASQGCYNCVTVAPASVEV